MFDVSLSEMIVVGIVALVVIGPEKLPKVAQTVGHLLGRLQRFVANDKYEINKEVQIQEIHKLQDEMESAAKSVGNTLHDVSEQLRREFTADHSIQNEPAQVTSNTSLSQNQTEKPLDNKHSD